MAKEITNHFVVIIAGPTGVGKTTLSKLLSKKYNCSYISEDEISKQFFPHIYKDVEDDPEKMRLIEDKLFGQIKINFYNGASIVVDCINLNKKFIENIKNEFKENLIIKILFPSIKITFGRDEKRDGWTSGKDVVEKFYKKYESLKNIIGKENFIDTSHQKPEDTLEIIVNNIN